MEKRRITICLIVGLLLSACSRPAAPIAATTATPTPSPLVFGIGETPQSLSGLPHVIRIKLTINSPSDLRVKPGQTEEAGELLSDRAEERRRATAQRRQLTIAAQRIWNQIETADESIALLESLGAELPARSFAAEQAAIRRAEADAAATARRTQIQRQRLSVLPSAIPASFDQAAIIEHEAVKLAIAEDGDRQATAEVELERAKLTSAQEERAFLEKTHRVEYARQMLAARSGQQQGEIARAQLAAQIAALDLQITQLVAVRAPFAGKVKHIEWEEQNDQTITVIVFLAVAQ